MKLSSCRDLKQEVLSRAYSIAAETSRRRTYRLQKARGKRKHLVRAVEDTPVAAVGVAPGKGRDYRLAVRVYRGSENCQHRLLAGLEGHLGEVDLAVGVRYQPRVTLQAGGSIGHYKITSGTLGGFVEDDNNYYMMSNNHVFANSNQCFGGDPILQPGPIDAGSSNPAVVGQLHQWFPLSKVARDGVDAAIATFDESVEFFNPWDYSGIGRIGKTAVSGRMSVSRVIKRGRTTGVTRGTVSAFELDGIQIDYGTRNDPAIVTFDDQVEVIGSPASRAFSAPGDSGSFIIDRDSMQAYALLYAGGTDSSGIDRTLAHFMPDVLKAMNVQLVQ